MKIFDFVKALLPHIDKSKIVEDLRVTIAELENIDIRAFQTASDHFKTNKLKSAINKDLSEVFYRNFDLLHGSKQSSFVSEISNRLPYIKENADYILDQVEELMERDIINEGLTAKKAILVRAAESLSFISRYSIDLLNYVYINEAIEVSSEVEEAVRLSPGAIKVIQKDITKFARLLSNYGIPNKDLSKIILAVPDVIVNSKSAASIAGIYKETDLDPFASNYVAGFTGSPIYHVRLLVAEWQASRYKANKDKKKMLELRLLHLKLLQDKKNDPKLEQELTYLQSRIDKISRYLIEVETSLDGVE